MPRSSPSACATTCCRRCRPRRRRARAPLPLRATLPSRAGCGCAPACGDRVLRRRASTSFLRAGHRVELGDQHVPGRRRPPQLSPKPLSAAPFERLERHALLLDPGVIAEVEDARALAMRQFEHVVVDGAEQMLAKDFAGADPVEPAGIALCQELASFAAVECRAV